MTPRASGHLAEDVAAHPRVHRDGGSGAGVDRPGRAELLDVEDDLALSAHPLDSPGPS